jgi:hypothetical protein
MGEMDEDLFDDFDAVEIHLMNSLNFTEHGGGFVEDKSLLHSESLRLEIYEFNVYESYVNTNKKKTLMSQET